MVITDAGDDASARSSGLMSGDCLSGVDCRRDILAMLAEDVDETELLELGTIEEDLKSFSEDEIVQEALHLGVDLRHYAAQIARDLEALQDNSIPQYVEEAPAVASVYGSISECDAGLAKMESILHGFQEKLGGISEEIHLLQERSQSMKVCVDNRQTVAEHYFRVLDKLVMSESFIVGICEGEINDSYILFIKELEEKVDFIKNGLAENDNDENQCFYGVPMEQVSAVQEIKPLIEKLQKKAVSRLHDFFLKCFARLKASNTNIQVLQQNVLLKYEYLMKFIESHSPSVFDKLKNAYVDIMSNMLYSTFKKYYTDLTKLQRPHPSKADVIAIEENLVADTISNVSSLYYFQSSERSFMHEKPMVQVSRREQELGDADAMPIILHIARASNASYHFEALFRSVQKHLMDSATSEYLFLLEFLDDRGTELFNRIIAKTLSLSLERIENALYSCNDIIALMLTIRVNQEHQFIMQKRRIPCLDGYLDHVNMMLWPQFKKLFETNLRSLRSASPEKLGSSRLTLKPHYVSLRYAQFASTVYTLNISLASADEMLPHNLSMLRSAYLELLESLHSSAVSSKHHHRALSTKKGKLIFRINNLYLVLSCFNEAAYGKDVAVIEEMLASDTSEYIEEELTQSFGEMIGFLKEEESLPEERDPEMLSTSAVKIVKIVQDFSANWKSHLKLYSSTVPSNLSDADNASLILQQLLTQFLLYYTRFRDIVVKHPNRNLQTNLVSVHQIMNEMKMAITS